MSKRKEKFHTRIIKLFLLLIAIMVSLQIVTLYFGASTIVSRLTSQLSDHLNERVIQRFATLRETPSGQVRVMGRFLQNTSETYNDIGASHQQLWNLMKLELNENPYLSSLHLADSDGNFLQVMRTPRLASRFIRREGDRATENWRYLDENFVTIDRAQNLTDFDPRLRPWYLDTTTEPVSQISKPYLFASSQVPGFTITYPVTNENGEIRQIVAADITLDSISGFLHEISATPNSRTFLITLSGAIIATSTANKLIVSDQETGKTRLLRVEELDSSLLNQVLTNYIDKGSEQIRLQEGEENIIVRIKRGVSDSILLISLIPESDLHGPVFKLIARSFLLFLAITLLATMTIYWVSRSISRPILLLSKEVGHIQDFTLDDFQGVDTRIAEVARMNDSLIAAVDALKSFEKYVPRELVKNIIQNEGTAKIGGREIEITLMFTDIENFTTISEKLQPHQLMEQLSEYFDALTGIISASGGTIDKYIGDAIMAFWGAPSPMEDGATAACRAALACQIKLDKLNHKWQEEGRPVMPTRIGIHSGKAIVGNVGSRDHINYSAIGDNVNIASRLEGLNKQFHTKILISEATFLLVKSRISCNEIGETQIKGKQKAIKVYQPITERPLGTCYSTHREL